MSHKKETRLAQILTKGKWKLFDKRKLLVLRLTNKRGDEKMTEIKKNDPIDSSNRKMKI